MIQIEGHWESVNSIDDVVNIVREYYNPELADIADELLDDLVDAFKQRIDELTYCDDNWDDSDCYSD